ncbi:GntR family transcriptional regulator [Kerstersia similis]|uniref:GntR family transcriptional regulator n=1 Tax=Kerstersia similis TaxID=206505 RepID=UPI0039EF1B4C
MSKRSFLAQLTATLECGEGDDELRTLTEQTYARLRADIIEGHLQPGSKLRIDHLRGQYGVSAGTLRESLTRLVSDALVTAEGQRGFRVSPIALEDLEDLTQLRVHIETHALRLAIRHGDGAWRQGLEASFAAMSEFEQPLTLARRRQWEILNARFHEALLAGHESPWTRRVLRLLTRHGERYRCFAMQLSGMTRDVHLEHKSIFELAMAGEDARAALALEAHICATPYSLMRALREGSIVLPGIVAERGVPV